MLFALGLGIIEGVLIDEDAEKSVPVITTMSAIFSLALSMPSLAVHTRRLHDIDKSGWWVLLWFMPIIGWIPLFVWLIKLGTTGPNRFGADPKEDV